MVEFTFNGKSWDSCCISFRYTYMPSTKLVYLKASFPQYLNLNGNTSVHVPANTVLLNVNNEDATRLIDEGVFLEASAEDCIRLSRGVCL